MNFSGLPSLGVGKFMAHWKEEQMAGSGSNGKMLVVGLFLAVVVVGIAVVDRKTDHFTTVKKWMDQRVGRANTKLSSPSF